MFPFAPLCRSLPALPSAPPGSCLRDLPSIPGGLRSSWSVPEFFGDGPVLMTRRWGQVPDDLVLV